MMLGAQSLRLETPSLSMNKSRILTGIEMEKDIFPGHCPIPFCTVLRAVPAPSCVFIHHFP